MSSISARSQRETLFQRFVGIVVLVSLLPYPEVTLVICCRHLSDNTSRCYGFGCHLFRTLNPCDEFALIGTELLAAKRKGHCSEYVICRHCAGRRRYKLYRSERVCTRTRAAGVTDPVQERGTIIAIVRRHTRGATFCRWGFVLMLR